MTPNPSADTSPAATTGRAATAAPAFIRGRYGLLACHLSRQMRRSLPPSGAVRPRIPGPIRGACRNPRRTASGCSRLDMPRPAIPRATVLDGAFS